MKQKKTPSSAPAEAKSNENKEKSNHKALKLTLFFLFLLVIILILLWLLRGKTTISGQYPENVKSSALECTSSSASYAKKLGTLSETSKETKISAVFYGDDDFNMISLRHVLTFASNLAATQAEAVAHANFNFSLHGAGYDDTTTFDNNFTILDNQLVVSIHGKKRDWNTFNKGYFMIESEEMPETLSALKTTYEAQGFSCRVIE
ncbi:hypothetical protein IJI72_00280 [Candidatus Saccharibacteria bacterium]|nr:hypothetical protein [Candidatus Saccharibacteria bacterium]